MMKGSQPSVSYFLYFFLFNLCFFSLQLALTYSQAGNFITAIHLPLTVYWELLKTLSIHIILYLLLSFFQTIWLLGIIKRSWHYFTAEQWQITIWIISVCALLSANAYYFPLSLFSKLLSPPIPHQFIKYVLYCSLSTLGILTVNSLFYRTHVRLLTIGAPLFIIALFTNNYYLKPDLKKERTTQPNIIILGIDSLSPESVVPENMPFLYHLLQNSTQFTHAMSPLARTYPAWSSILTGLYAEHHHAEENLVAKNTVTSEKSIAWLLSKQGYHTIFATDDRRFNSIDKEFGFKQIIGPKLGVNDVLLGGFNDFPLSNLLINCQLGSWLFPYNHINRASFFSYYPETFSTTLQNELFASKQKYPVFLAVHFTLPHWPYAWAESMPEDVNNEFNLEKRGLLYQRALNKVDWQFKALFDFLKEENYFENSLIIILSDHGEALYYPNSRLTNYHNYQGKLPSKLAEYFKTQTATDLDKSAGHGSDILSPKQYHSVMGFYIFNNGQKITTNTTIQTRIALIDLAPTILDFVHMDLNRKMDGISLLKTINNPQAPPKKRTFFIESGMFPNQDISKAKAMKIGKQYYRVNPLNDEIEIKANKLNFFNHQKLYGVISGPWIFALYPNHKEYIPVIQNLDTGAWSDDLHSQFAITSPAETLNKQLQDFYGKKLVLPPE